MPGEIPGKPEVPSRPEGDLLGMRLSTAVVNFHETVARRLNLGAAEWKCLGVLGQVDPPTAGNLAAATGFTTGAITGILDRLEKLGYVRREPNPRDRRSVLIRALRMDEIQAQVGPIFQSLSQAMAELAGRYSSEELAAIHDYLSRTTEVLKAETVKLRK